MTDTAEGQETPKKKTGFALLTPEQRTAIARKAGQASSNKFQKGEQRTVENAKRGGKAASVTSPFSFALNKDHAKKAGREGHMSQRIVNRLMDKGKRRDR
jgi:general stress protein YciG